MAMMTYKQIIQKIKKAKNIAIFAHREPDPDACGSMFSLREFCRQIGKNADIFVSRDKRECLPQIFPLNDTKNLYKTSDYDLAIMVDLHDFKRIDDEFQNELKLCQNLIAIDHHSICGDEGTDVKNCRIDNKKASASQMILDLFRTEEIKPSQDACTYIYAGLMGDTNRFLNTNLSREVFEDAICLLENDANVQDVYEAMYRSISKHHIVLSEFLYKNLVLNCNSRVAHVIFDLKSMKKLKAIVNDIKEFSNELIKIQGVDLAFLIIESSKNHFKFSMRSSKEINLVPFASKMGGGGHPNASAFEIDITKTQINKNIAKWATEILNG